MAWDVKTTTAAFVGVIVLGVLAMLGTPMTPRTIGMMVVPSMVVFGLVTLLISVKHGEHRAQR